MDRRIKGPPYPSWKRRPAHDWDRRYRVAGLLVCGITVLSVCGLIGLLVYLFTH